MEELNTLRNRVEETAEKLANLHVERQEQSHSLISTLVELEKKYTAQEEQLNHYKARMEPLEQSNADLAVLLENLLDLIDRGFGEDSLGSIRSATGMATRMLSEDLVDPTGEGITPEPVVEDMADAEAETAEDDMVSFAESDPVEETFEDIAEDALAAELEEDPVTDDLPEVVKACCGPAAIAEPETFDLADAVETESEIEDDELSAEMEPHFEEPGEIEFEELVSEADEEIVIAEVGEIEEEIVLEEPAAAEPVTLYAPEDVDDVDFAAEPEQKQSTDIRSLLERVQNLANKAEAMQDETADGAQEELDEIARAVEEAQKQAAVG